MAPDLLNLGKRTPYEEKFNGRHFGKLGLLFEFDDQIFSNNSSATQFRIITAYCMFRHHWTVILWCML